MRPYIYTSFRQTGGALIECTVFDHTDPSVDSAPVFRLSAMENPLTIRHTGGEIVVSPLQSSRATLRLFVPHDGTEERIVRHLCAAPSLSFRLLVRRDGRPYWGGWLDSESIETPYDGRRGGVLELSFGDFKPLKHLRSSYEGVLRNGDALGRLLGQLEIPLHYHDAISAEKSDGSPFEWTYNPMTVGADQGTAAGRRRGYTPDVEEVPKEDTAPAFVQGWENLYTGTGVLHDKGDSYTLLETIVGAWGLMLKQYDGAFHLHSLLCPLPRTGVTVRGTTNILSGSPSIYTVDYSYQPPFPEALTKGRVLNRLTPPRTAGERKGNALWIRDYDNPKTTFDGFPAGTAVALGSTDARAKGLFAGLLLKADAKGAFPAPVVVSSPPLYTTAEPLTLTAPTLPVRIEGRNRRATVVRSAMYALSLRLHIRTAKGLVSHYYDADKQAFVDARQGQDTEGDNLMLYYLTDKEDAPPVLTPARDRGAILKGEGDSSGVVVLSLPSGMTPGSRVEVSLRGAFDTTFLFTLLLAGKHLKPGNCPPLSYPVFLESLTIGQGGRESDGDDAVFFRCMRDQGREEAVRVTRTAGISERATAGSLCAHLPALSFLRRYRHAGVCTHPAFMIADQIFALSRDAPSLEVTLRTPPFGLWKVPLRSDLYYPTQEVEDVKGLRVRATLLPLQLNPTIERTQL